MNYQTLQLIQADIERLCSDQTQSLSTGSQNIQTWFGRQILRIRLTEADRFSRKEWKQIFEELGQLGKWLAINLFDKNKQIKKVGNLNFLFFVRLGLQIFRTGKTIFQIIKYKPSTVFS